MKKYLMLVLIFLIFGSLVYSQKTLIIIGEKISASIATVPISYTPIFDTLTNVGFMDPSGKKIDTFFIVKVIAHVNRAVYKVLEVVKGDFKNDTVKFIFSDKNHVSSSKNVLLFLSKTGNHSYVLKQQPVEVYITKDNRWACPYTVEIDKYSQIKFQKLKFKSKLVFDVSMYDDEYIKKHYPSPYYKIKKNKAFAVQGIYVDELSDNGVLREPR
jgi:hypothetical protein